MSNIDQILGLLDQRRFERSHRSDNQSTSPPLSSTRVSEERGDNALHDTAMTNSSYVEIFERDDQSTVAKKPRRNGEAKGTRTRSSTKKKANPRARTNANANDSQTDDHQREEINQRKE
jgi:hypothetical protein